MLGVCTGPGAMNGENNEGEEEGKIGMYDFRGAQEEKASLV